MTTTTTADRILAHLAYVVGRDDGWLPTAREIADDIGVNPSTVTTALRRLEYLGKVRPVGEASGGGRTWTLAKQADGGVEVCDLCMQPADLCRCDGMW